jgi:hypothetical protein
MNLTRSLLVLALSSVCLPALADDADSIQRNINQQKRIEQGLQSGQLTVQEAGRLEREQAAVERMQAHALRDGTVTEREEARLDHVQDKVSRDIYRQKHDEQTGNPDSPSAQRMQADVQRNINQQQRIHQGMESGALTNHEAARLERGESHINRVEARAAHDGHIGPVEQQRIQNKETRESRRIYRQKHDRQHLLHKRDLHQR